MTDKSTAPKHKQAEPYVINSRGPRGVTMTTIDGDELFVPYTRSRDLAKMLLIFKLLTRPRAFYRISQETYRLAIERTSSAKEPVQPAQETKKPLQTLASLTDWIPFPGIRKRQKKLLADEVAEITQFCNEGRKWLARWRAIWTWAHWLRYLFSGPFSAFFRMLWKPT